VSDQYGNNVDGEIRIPVKREKPLEYFAYQDVPDDFAQKADLVASLISSRVEYLLDRVLADGRNPLEGDLSVEPRLHLGSVRVRFTWAMHE
jgi:hypothetical protein